MLVIYLHVSFCCACAGINQLSTVVVQALVEIGDTLGLRSPLHPRLDDTQPIASSLTEVQLDARSSNTGDSGTVAADGEAAQGAGSLTVQLLTNASTNELRCVQHTVSLVDRRQHMSSFSVVLSWTAVQGALQR